MNQGLNHVFEYVTWNGTFWKASLNNQLIWEHHEWVNGAEVSWHSETFIKFKAENTTDWKAVAVNDGNFPDFQLYRSTDLDNVNNQSPILRFIDWNGDGWETNIVDLVNGYYSFDLRRLR